MDIRDLRFLTEDAVEREPRLGIPELNSGFVPHDELRSVKLLKPEVTPEGAGS